MPTNPEEPRLVLILGGVGFDSALPPARPPVYIAAADPRFAPQRRTDEPLSGTRSREAQQRWRVSLSARRVWCWLEGPEGSALRSLLLRSRQDAAALVGPMDSAGMETVQFLPGTRIIEALAARVALFVREPPRFSGGGGWLVTSRAELCRRAPAALVNRLAEHIGSEAMWASIRNKLKHRH